MSVTQTVLQKDYLLFSKNLSRHRFKTMQIFIIYFSLFMKSINNVFIAL